MEEHDEVTIMNMSWLESMISICSLKRQGLRELRMCLVKKIRVLNAGVCYSILVACREKMLADGKYNNAMKDYTGLEYAVLIHVRRTPYGALFCTSSPACGSYST